MTVSWHVPTREEIAEVIADRLARAVTGLEWSNYRNENPQPVEHEAAPTPVRHAGQAAEGPIGRSR